MKQLTKPLIILAFVIIISASIVRIYSSGETVADYARKNPAIAYATPDASSKPSVTSVPSVLQPGDTHSGTQSGGTLAGTQSGDTLAGTQSAVNPSGSHTAVPSPDTSITPAPDTEKSREIYQPDFYKESLNENLIAYITGISYPISASEAEAIAGSSKSLPAETDIVPVVNIIEDGTDIAISYDQLRYLSILYYDFNGEVQIGELICNESIADDLLEIFYELYLNQYPIEKVRLIEEYNGDDTLSMLDNNTSGFNYRIVDGTSNLSKHALGLAIDINPFYNPYVVYRKDGSTYISPKGSEIYTDRSQDFPYKIDENDLCYQLFMERGFTWGGNWKTMKDYQHFQKS